MKLDAGILARLRPLLLCALLAATLDIVFAIVFWALRAAVPARAILQSVAAGLLGRAAFTGGASTAALGLALHFTIVIVMAIAYYAAAQRRPALVRWPVRCGMLYGLFLYWAMNYVVVPLSAAAPAPPDPWWIVLGVAVHMVLVGVPIALGARWSSLRNA